MKCKVLSAFVLALLAETAGAAVAQCTEDQRRALVPSAGEIREHRKTPLPDVGYPHGTRRQSWQFDLIVRIGTSGRVECFDEPPASDWRETLRGINGPRRAVIEGLADWRYEPFLRDGRPVAVSITETLREYEVPLRRRAAPKVPLDQVHITLTRTSCFGMCPDYQVEISGDGQATFTGNAFTAVRGSHRYPVDPAKVAALVERVHSSNVWSARSRYFAPITDNPTFTVRIQLGKAAHTIVDYAGGWVGMPPSVTEFQEAVDEAAGSHDFIHFSMRALEVLQKEGFRFDSVEGARLLSRAVNDVRSDDAALARLVELGAPIELPADAKEVTMAGQPGPPLLRALEYRYPMTVEALIAHDALELHGSSSQEALDAAFRAAIAGGDLALVERIWNVGGEDLRPSITFEDAEEGSAAWNADVITLIASGWGARVGDHVEIAEFLVSRGSVLSATRANGETLLHRAAAAEDMKFVRFLLSKGFDPSVADDDGITPLGSTHSEEVSLLLLEAGADTTRMASRGYSYRKFAQSNGWYRVLAWLDAHGM